ncbi:MAG TPA: 1-(5-phosphoribosyl)-5-[(5-phosphoribosylamino)methylideneamino]imidazole-4-carboxamide isomerase [Gemmatimonadales bacterium]|nr:1-(5-phosphoribosyl)-5-[(5-phosphoribosylamino)methylideneamino]imidazole-4-carboxamide isomerase [Gemmatimonadales bacterium]
MHLYPAIDLRQGRVVRLAQGEAGRETAYHADPVAVAEAFVQAGAQWLHVVDLDRAFGTGSNTPLIRRVVESVRGRARVQIGGGIRSLAALDEVLALGVDRVVLGTAVAREPALVPAALARAGNERIAVGLDARGGRIAIRGWTETTDLLLEQVAVQVRDQGVVRVVYTDVARDGMLTGPDLGGARALGELGLRVILSGGIASLNDLRAARAAGLEGAIVGRALYEGRFGLAQALEAAGA